MQDVKYFRKSLVNTNKLLALSSPRVSLNTAGWGVSSYTSGCKEQGFGFKSWS